MQIENTSNSGKMECLFGFITPKAKAAAASASSTSNEVESRKDVKATLLDLSLLHIGTADSIWKQVRALESIKYAVITLAWLRSSTV